MVKLIYPICNSESKFWVTAPEYIFPEDSSKEQKMLDLFRCTLYGTDLFILVLKAMINLPFEKVICIFYISPFTII